MAKEGQSGKTAFSQGGANGPNKLEGLVGYGNLKPGLMQFFIFSSSHPPMAEWLSVKHLSLSWQLSLFHCDAAGKKALVIKCKGKELHGDLIVDKGPNYRPCAMSFPN